MIKISYLYARLLIFIAVLGMVPLVQEQASAFDQRVRHVTTPRPRIVQRQTSRPTFRPTARRPIANVQRPRVVARRPLPVARHTSFPKSPVVKLGGAQHRVPNFPKVGARFPQPTRTTPFRPSRIGGDVGRQRIGSNPKPIMLDRLPRTGSLGNAGGPSPKGGTKRFDVSALPKPNSIGIRSPSTVGKAGTKTLNLANLPRPNSIGGKGQGGPKAASLAGIPHDHHLASLHFAAHGKNGNGVGGAAQKVGAAKQDLSKAQAGLFDAKTKLTEGERIARQDQAKQASAAAGLTSANNKLNDANKKVATATQDLGAKDAAANQALAAQKAAQAKLATALRNPLDLPAISKAQASLNAANAQVAATAVAKSQAQGAVNAAKQDASAAQNGVNTAQKELGAAERASNNAQASVAGDKKAVAEAQQKVAAEHGAVSAAEQALADKRQMARQQREIDQLQNQQAAQNNQDDNRGAASSDNSGGAGTNSPAVVVAQAPAVVTATSTSVNSTSQPLVTQATPPVVATAPVAVATAPQAAPQGSETPGAPTEAPASIDVIAVLFQKDLSAADMATFLQTYKVTIVEGPDDNGVFKLKLEESLPADQLQQLIDSMKSQTAVVADAGVP